jgi:hypothetical protein
MIVFIQRFDKSNTLHTIRGKLNLDSRRELTMFFTESNPPTIALNDGNEHKLTEIRMTVLELFIDGPGIYVKGIVDIGGKIHKDGFCFYTVDPRTFDQ